MIAVTAVLLSSVVVGIALGIASVVVIGMSFSEDRTFPL